MHGNGVEQCLHVFQNGNVYLVFPCGFFCEGELEAPAALDEASVVAGDDLVGSLGNDMESCLVVVVNVEPFDRPPLVGSILDIVAHCERPGRGL